jgi:DNA repair exonuclease SbcCD nuclease subunit
MRSGVNQRCLDVLDTVEGAVAVAKREGASYLVIPGDLYDTKNPSPPVQAAMQVQLTEIHTIVIKGNHDSVSTDVGDHALGPLQPVATIVDEPRVMGIGNTDLVCIPFMPGRPKDWLPYRLADLKRTNDDAILAMHMGVYDGDTDEFLRVAEDAIDVQLLIELCRANRIQTAVVGNWHWPQDWHSDDGDVSVYQIGTLAPSRFTDEGLDHGNVVIVEEEVQRFQVPGPRFFKVGSKSDLAKLQPIDMPAYVKAEVVPEELTEVRQMLQEMDWLRGWEAFPNRKADREAAKTASKSAAAAPTTRRAVAKFVKNMPLDSDIEREEVEKVSIGYLQGGSNAE